MLLFFTRSLRNVMLNAGVKKQCCDYVLQNIISLISWLLINLLMFTVAKVVFFSGIYRHYTGFNEFSIQLQGFLFSHKENYFSDHKLLV